MKHRIRPLLALALIVAACTEHNDGESVAPADDSSQAAATKTEADSKATAVETPNEVDAPAAEPEPEPAAPPPDRMFVVAEGRCRHLDVSLVDGRTFLHYQPQSIVEFDADGAPTGFSIDTTIPRDPKDAGALVWEEHLPQIERLGGHFPDHVFAEVMQYPREGIRSAYRMTPNGWQQARPFGESGLDRMWPWYDDSLLAFAPWVDGKGPRFGVVRGKPKGPRLDALRNKTGCKEVELRQALVLERGDVVATWTCQAHPLYVTHWRAGDLAGMTHDLGITPVDRYSVKIGAPRITADADDGFYVASESEAGTSHLWHGKDEDWKPVELPAPARLEAVATDPEGRLWIAGDTIARRDGAEWTTIPNPGGTVLELVGVEHGTPWIRNGSRIWRIADDDTTHEIAVPPSAFFEDERLEVERIYAAGPDDVWAVATFVVQRRGKGTPGRYYRAVLHSRANEHPLRCGELTDGREIGTPYRKWPTAAGEGCTQRMLLLLRRTKWDDTNPYAKVARAVKTIEGIETARFAEMELGGEKYLVALAPDATLLEAIKTKTKRLTRFKFPEVVCGDPAVLDAAGVVVHRELDLLAPTP